MHYHVSFHVNRCNYYDNANDYFLLRIIVTVSFPKINLSSFI